MRDVDLEKSEVQGVVPNLGQHRPIWVHRTTHEGRKKIHPVRSQESLTGTCGDEIEDDFAMSRFEVMQVLAALTSLWRPSFK